MYAEEGVQNRAALSMLFRPLVDLQHRPGFFISKTSREVLITEGESINE